jgi:hypothetical protein
MKNMKRELIKTIKVDKANMLHIAESGKINGTLLLEIERVMDDYKNNDSNQNEMFTSKYKLSLIVLRNLLKRSGLTKGAESAQFLLDEIDQNGYKIKETVGSICKDVLPDSKAYWKMRCEMLEKSLDNTYSEEEKTFYSIMHHNLMHKR